MDANRGTAERRLDFAFGPRPGRLRAEAAFRMAELRRRSARRAGRLVLLARPGGTALRGFARLGDA
jgi:hypothetical protein